MGHAHQQGSTTESAAPQVQATQGPATELGTANSTAMSSLDAGQSPDAKGPAPGGGQFLDSTASVKALNDAFGSIKKITAGKVEVLDQAAFQKAWDKIYSGTKYAWDPYITKGSGNLEGFAYDGTSFINKDTASIDTVPHEILHNNGAAGWDVAVGSEFNEGVTEYMTIYAMNKLGKTPTHSYPDQEGVVQALIKAGLPQNDLFKAYLTGGQDTLVIKWVDDNCTGTWAQFKTAMDASDWATAKSHLAKKK